jgi:hypothetical protein
VRISLTTAHLFVLLAILATQPAAASSSPTTGTLRGVVRDSDRVPIAEAQVMISGALLPTGRAETTDARGEYRFALLPPGEYAVSVSKNGFESLLQRVTVSLGVEATLDLALRHAFRDEVTVVAARPLIDTTTSAVSTNITAEEFMLLPTRRDFQQITTHAPGVIMDTRSSVSPTVSGSTHLENDYNIEGVSTRDPAKGRSAANLTMNFVQEVQIITTAAGAEYGRSLGGIINVVTRSGSNVLSGDIAAYYEPSSLASHAVVSAFRGFTASSDGRDTADVALSLGGPLRRDLAWFFAAVNPRKTLIPSHLSNPESGIDRQVEIKDREDVYALKLTAAPHASQFVSFSAFGHPSRYSGWLSSALADPDSALQEFRGGSRNLSLRYDRLFSRGDSIQVSAGSHRQSNRAQGLTEIGRTVPLQFDLTSFFQRGGTGYTDDSRLDRRSAAIRGRGTWGRNSYSGGIELEKNRNDSRSVSSGFYYYGPSFINSELGQQDFMEYYSVDTTGWGTNDATYAFLEDTIRLGENVTATVGVRWERQVISSARGVTIVEGIAPNGSFLGRPERNYTFDDNWAPRLGVVWDPSRRGRAKVYAAGGRFFEAIPTSLNINALSGWAVQQDFYYSLSRFNSANWYNPTGSPVTSDWILFDSSPRHSPQRAAGIDPDLKLQYQDEFSFGGEVLLGKATTVGVRYVDRRIKRVIDTRGTWNPNNLRQSFSETFFVNIGEGEYGSMFDRPERKYQAVHLTLNRRLTDRWQLISSFVSARQRGDYDGLFEYSSNRERPNEAFGWDTPGLQRNSYGRLRGDVPYQFKLASSVQLPYGLVLSESLFYSAGRPVSMLAPQGVTIGRRVLHLVPRGTAGRTADYWTLDLHGEWRPPFLGLRHVSLVADVFNATNNHEAVELDEAYFYAGMPGFNRWTTPDNRDEWGYPRYDPSLPGSVYYKTPTLYQAPRSVQLGVRIRY